MIWKKMDRPGFELTICWSRGKSLTTVLTLTTIHSVTFYNYISELLFVRSFTHKFHANFTFLSVLLWQLAIVWMKLILRLKLTKLDDGKGVKFTGKANLGLISAVLKSPASQSFFTYLSFLPHFHFTTEVRQTFQDAYALNQFQKYLLMWQTDQTLSR